MTTKGHCLCGATRYEFNGAMTFKAHCHCESCRRNCSAPFTTFFGVPRPAFRWTGDEVGTYKLSPGVRRHFCKTCGTPMAYDAEYDKDDTHLYAASLEDHTSFVRQKHYHHEEMVSWVTLGDNLKGSTEN